MTKSICKYPLETKGRQVVSLPIGSEILSVQEQDRQLFLWALVDPNEQLEERHIKIFTTGDVLDNDFGVPNKYIATVQLKFEGLVIHVFENQLKKPLRP